ncbi:MAG: hypothetical protein HYV09_06525 [Deltaproteobacteria bacterium]|nr:hypothetical protein [Deltaproteobacteria bacterium]
MRFLVFSALLVASTSCSPRAVTSGQIGCPASEITITNDESGWSTRTWTAHCRGKTYYCSSHSGGGSQATAQVSCKEAQQPASGAVESSSDVGGCKYDTQCKGERVCQNGRCVEPQ